MIWREELHALDTSYNVKLEFSIILIFFSSFIVPKTSYLSILEVSFNSLFVK
jgi:hypothetical protein